jgi:DNA polymerase (family 10)
VARTDKSAVIRTLRDISLLLQLRGENAFKSRAYEVAADRLSGLPDDLSDWVRNHKLREIPGIGAALEEKITELWETGRLGYFDKLMEGYPPGILQLVRVPDLGPKRASALWESLGIGDVDALEAACKEGRIRSLKGFGERSESKILEGIQVFRRQKTSRRPLHEALAVANPLLSFLRACPGVVRADVAGSVRRFCETVSDIDFVASATSPQPIMDAFASRPEVYEVLAKGDTKCSVRLWKGELQADLRIVPDEDYATALHHFTGSKAHHIRLRGRALDLGMKISEWGLLRGEEKLKVPDEATLYRFLGMSYVPPELREDAGEVEAALAGQLPDTLLSISDIAGAVHCHTDWSDGKNTLAEMALAAQEMGLSYLTITDHSQAAHYAGGLTQEELVQQWDEIDALNEKLTTLRLLKGTEVDILEDGRLDFPDELLQRLDIVIASIHQRHQLNEEQMTRRVLNAFDNPHMHILGHPTGRLLGSREPYGLVMEKVLDKAAEKGIAIEVNGSPHRLDIKSEYVRMAIQRGTRLVVSVDAHSTAELGYLKFAVGTARKGWAQKQNILNTLPHELFLKTLREMRH